MDIGDSHVKALTFDVFGTVVDWRNSVVPQVVSAAVAKYGVLERDWWEFADRWRQGYSRACGELSRGEGEWKLVDQIHRERLDELLDDFGLADLFTEAEKQDLNRAWHRLDGWHDSSDGLRRLKSKFIISTLSNGNFSLLVNMAKHADLAWDAIISPDIVGAYKPSPKVYQGAAEILGLEIGEVMMVAAHTGDLHAAQTLGMATAFVHRPAEHGDLHPTEIPEEASSFDFVASDFHDLADQLGCE